MQTKTWAALAAGVVVVAAGAVAVAVASDWGGERKRGRHGPGRGHSLHLVQYDADKDGRITRGEIDAGLTAQFQGADSNKDGKLDAAEFQKYNDARKAERKARIEAWRAKRQAEGGDAKERPPSGRGPRHFDPMKSMDWNLDGAVTPDEFGGKTRSQAMRADRDGDGTILIEDLKKKRGKWRRGKERSSGEQPPAQP
jgi:hypothetical protein